MVRFIIYIDFCQDMKNIHIYIPIWLDLLYNYTYEQALNYINLHSNMVRFIICISEKRPESNDKFTFQYG